MPRCDYTCNFTVQWTPVPPVAASQFSYCHGLPGAPERREVAAETAPSVVVESTPAGEWDVEQYMDSLDVLDYGFTEMKSETVQLLRGKPRIA